MTKNALIITDIQYDFCPGGALGVNDADSIIPLVNTIARKFHRVVATQDWHPKDHISLASNHDGKREFEQIIIDSIEQTLWPDHCIQGTRGAELHDRLDKNRIDLIIRKGTHRQIDSYSAFLENDRETKTGLDGYFNSLGIEEIFMCGIATDYCVYYSAMDSINFGFKTTLIIDACRGIDFPDGSIDQVINDMKRHGIKIIHSRDL